MGEKNNKLTKIGVKDEAAEMITRDLTTIRETIKSVSKKSLEIKEQGGWDSFWSTSENIQSLAGYINDMTLLHQKTVNILILLLNGTVRMKKDYNEIMEAIDVLSEGESDVKILAYLLDLKKSVKDIKERNDFISDKFDDIDNEIKKMHDKLEITMREKHDKNETAIKNKVRRMRLFFGIPLILLIIYEIIKSLQIL
jgi:hypothetical protein